MKKKLLIIIPLCILLVATIVASILAKPYCYKYNDYRKAMTTLETSNNGNNLVVMSSNLRGYSSDDKYEECFTSRAPYLKKNLESINPDIIGFQEYSWVHKKFIKKVLSDYDYNLKNKKLSKKSEGCPIYYKKDRFNLIDSNSFWLSETPDVESYGWDAACIRVCSYAILKDNNTNKEIAVFNTHLDHISKKARIEGIKLVISKINELDLEGKSTILMGDMNDWIYSTTIETLFDYFDDSATIAKDYNNEEESKVTFHAYGKYLNGYRIDYIATKNIEVNSYKVLDKSYINDEGKVVYPSDHFPVYINITLK